MSIAAATPAVDRYEGDGTAVEYTANWRIMNNQEISVLLDGVVQIYGSQYSLSGVGNSTTQVTFFTAPEADVAVTLIRNQPISQLSGYVPNEAYNPVKTLNDFDRCAMVDQMLAEKIGRAPLLSTSSTFSGITLPDPEDGRYLQWSGGDLINVAAFDASLTASLTTAGVVFSDTSSSITTSPTQFGWDNANQNLLVKGIGLPLLNIDLAGEGQTTNKVSQLFSGTDPGDHNGFSHALTGFHFKPIGSGTNGPDHADWTLLVSAMKDDFATSVIDGQVTAMGIYVRQGTLGDANFADINVAGYGTAFYAAYEAKTTRFNAASEVQDMIGVQTCVHHEAGAGSLGYFASKVIGTGGDAFRADVAAGQTWENWLNFLIDGVEVAHLDFNGGYWGNALFINVPSNFGGNRLVQITQVEGAPAVTIRRGTDSSPTSHYIECLNAAFDANRFVVTAAEPASDGQTPVGIAYHNGSTIAFAFVSLDVDDSGGIGFRALRVPN
jgi:hypothetical protein